MKKVNFIFAALLAVTVIPCMEKDRIDKKTTIAGLQDIPGARGKDGGVGKSSDLKVCALDDIPGSRGRDGSVGIKTDAPGVYA